MVPQLWETITEVKRRSEEKRWATRWLALSGKRALLEVTTEGEVYWADAIEHQEPLAWSSLEALIKQLEERNLVLLTTGSLPNTIVAELLRHPARKQIAVIAMGLDNHAKAGSKAKKFGETKTPLFDLTEGILEEKGIRLGEITCGYCNQKTLTACHLCHSLLCKEHFLCCPLCGLYLCHPDVKDCYFHH